MRTWMLPLIVGCGVILVAGCASSGTKVTEQQASQFQRGVTTREQIVARLGTPNSTSMMNDGSRIDVYVHIQAQANAASYIPVVGLLAGGATSESQTASFIYDPNGILKEVSTGSSKGDVSTGLLNQH